MKRSNRSCVRPLIARPGAAYACDRHGLCCTDIHLLGALSRAEARQIRAIEPDSVRYDPEAEGPAIDCSPHGRCRFLNQSGCRIHATLGSEAKASPCRRFPYGLIATPVGGRVTTEHRCPGRTLGEHAGIDLNEAEASLRVGARGLVADDRIEEPVSLDRKHRVSFRRYTEIESAMLARLASGERAERVLQAKPLPRLNGPTWKGHAGELVELEDSSAWAVAMVWFGDALLELGAGMRPPRRDRPWAPVFEKAAKGRVVPRSPEALYNDWVADELWMLRGLLLASFMAARAELATRLAAARIIARRLQARGVRPDQAAAESVLVAEIAAISSDWPGLVGAIAPGARPVAGDVSVSASSC